MTAAHVTIPVVEWTEEIPLPTLLPVEDFPADALPKTVREMVEAVSESVATPFDYAATIALGATAVLTARNVTVQVHERASYAPRANLYVAAVMSVAAGKSPVFRAFTRELYKIEEAWIESLKDVRSEQRHEKELAERIAKKAMTKVVEKGGPKDEMKRAIKLAVEAEGMEITPEPRLIANDATPEVVPAICERNGGTLALISDEGLEVLQMTRRYASNGGSNLGYLLQGFDGGEYRSDRKTTGSIVVKNLVLTAVLCIQEDAVDELTNDVANRNRGLLARFLVTMPENNIGHRPTDRPDVPEGVSHEWNNVLHRIARWVGPSADAVALVFSREAEAEYQRWLTTVEPRLRKDTGDLGMVQDWGGKDIAHLLRLAGVLHMLEQAERYEGPLHTEVSVTTIQNAIAIWEYFASHTKRVFAKMMGESLDLQRARRILRWIERNKHESFTERDAFRGCQSTLFDSIDDVRDGLTRLAEHGYIRQASAVQRIGNSRGGRPPSAVWDVNPKWADKTDRTDETNVSMSSVGYVSGGPLMISTSSSSSKNSCTASNSCAEEKLLLPPERTDATDKTSSSFAFDDDEVGEVFS
jgi:replicative DNA helicase